MRLYYGWVIVSYGIVATCIGVGTLTSLSVFLQPVAAELGASRAGVSSVSTLGFLAMGVGGFIWGTLADRFGTRAVVFAGGVLLGVGLLAASQARDLTELQIAYGLVVGLAAGSSFAPLTALTSSWFDRHRSLAVALVSMGLGRHHHYRAARERHHRGVWMARSADDAVGTRVSHHRARLADFATTAADARG